MYRVSVKGVQQSPPGRNSGGIEGAKLGEGTNADIQSAVKIYAIASFSTASFNFTTITVALGPLVAQLRSVSVRAAPPVVGVHRTSAARARNVENDPKRSPTFAIPMAFEKKRLADKERLAA